jgi:hypothetical protein
MLHRMHRRPLIVAAIVATTVLIGAPAATAETAESRAELPGFRTRERPYLVSLVDGVRIKPLLTTGDVIGGVEGGYQMSGIPDGLGAYSRSNGTIELFMNHELNGQFDASDARVSHLTLSGRGRVLAARYAIDGSEGFQWFCSSTLEILGGVPWYFTGEETNKSPRDGSSIALNAATGRWVETPHFGHLSHENIVPVTRLAKAYLGISEDGFGEPSQLYAYTADRFTAAIRGKGSLRVWVPDEQVPDGNPSPNDISKGETMPGHFVRLRDRDNFDSETLERVVQRKGAFDFSRIEDQIDDPNRPGVIYFSETGVANQETTHGRVYKLRLNPDNPARARLSVVLDADAGDDIFSPDNLGISDKALVIQEDRNWARSGYNRVLVYDLSSGSLTPVARTDPSKEIIEAEGLGAWESSGVLDASPYFGRGWWLLDVQAHDFIVRVPGPSLEVDSARDDGGQLLLVYIPGT